jgi:hypothetical protein
MATAVPPLLNEEYTMSRTEAMLAGTLALMTGHAQSCTTADREAMAHKIGVNLSALSEDPMLSPGLQALLWALRSRWDGVQHGAAALYGQAPSLWHRSPEAVQ